jgi:hypothetical protein
MCVCVSCRVTCTAPSRILSSLARSNLHPLCMYLSLCSRNISVRSSLYYQQNLTTRSRILIDKLVVAQLVKQLPVFFMEPEDSSARSQEPTLLNDTLSQCNSVQHSHSIPLKYILMLSFHVCLWLRSDHILSGFPTIILYAFRIFPILATCPGHNSLIFGEEYKVWSSSLCNISVLLLLPLLQQKPSKYSHLYCSQTLSLCDTSYSFGCDYEEFYLLGCDAMQCGRILLFRGAHCLQIQNRSGWRKIFWR